MDFDLDNVRSSLDDDDDDDDDRLSDLPPELILQIFTRVDTKLAIQMCLLLNPRWKLIWTLMPCLNFSSSGFKTLAELSKFVTYVLTHRNHQVELSSVNLCLPEEDTQDFVREIANYAFSNNVQELILDIRPKNEFPSYLFMSQTLKHLTFRTCTYACVTPKTQWDFPALTTLYLDGTSLCKDERESVDLFSKCINLQNLTLEHVAVNAKVFEIITPRLSNLRLIHFSGSDVINVIAPQLENLTMINCYLKEFNIPSGFSSFCYQGLDPPQWYKDFFYSVNKVSVSLNLYRPENPYKHEDARGIIKMLQDLHSAKFLTLNLDIVECISSFPELISTQPSPFRKLIRLNIDSSTRDTCKLKMSTEAKNFLLGNSPNATFIMKELATEEMKYKEIMAKLVADIEDVIKELVQSSLEEHDKIIIIKSLIFKKENVRYILNRLPKQEMIQMEAHYSTQVQQAEALIARSRLNI